MIKNIFIIKKLRQTLRVKNKEIKILKSILEKEGIYDKYWRKSNNQLKKFINELDNYTTHE